MKRICFITHLSGCWHDSEDLLAEADDQCRGVTFLLVQIQPGDGPFQGRQMEILLDGKALRDQVGTVRLRQLGPPLPSRQATTADGEARKFPIWHLSCSPVALILYRMLHCRRVRQIRFARRGWWAASRGPGWATSPSTCCCSPCGRRGWSGDDGGGGGIRSRCRGTTGATPISAIVLRNDFLPFWNAWRKIRTPVSPGPARDRPLCCRCRRSIMWWRIPFRECVANQLLNERT